MQLNVSSWCHVIQSTWLQTDIVATLKHFEWQALKFYLKGKTALGTVRYSHKLNICRDSPIVTNWTANPGKNCELFKAFVTDDTKKLSEFGRSMVNGAQRSCWCHNAFKCAATNFGYISCDQAIKIDPQLSSYGHTGQLNMAPRPSRIQVSGHAITNPRIAESRKCDEAVIMCSWWEGHWTGPNCVR